MSEPDRGVYDAYNKALAMASGRYVWLLNAGDLAKPGALETALQSIRAGLDEPSLPVHCYSVHQLDRNRVWEADPQSLRKGISMSTQGVLAPRSALMALGGFDTSFRIAADYDLWLRLALQGRHPFRTHRQVLVAYKGYGLSIRHRHLGVTEEIAIQLRHMPDQANDWLLRAVRYGVFNVDPGRVPWRRWSLALRMARRLLY